ncbi:hypothetical protein JCM9533A_57970 [Catenuloplanes niger JCM 9533]
MAGECGSHGRDECCRLAGDTIYLGDFDRAGDVRAIRIRLEFHSPELLTMQKADWIKIVGIAIIGRNKDRPVGAFVVQSAFQHPEIAEAQTERLIG